jgi:lipoic acid synthetase
MKKRTLPRWMKIRLPTYEKLRGYNKTLEIIKRYNLNTVCISANCPNSPECFSNKTATFMILGNVCTRDCLYCNIGHAKTLDVDHDEPNRISQAVKELGLRYVVITSVTRDDLPDKGAQHFFDTVTRLKSMDCKIEVLIPDFCGDLYAFGMITKSNPDVINHNIEIARRFFRRYRPQGDYDRSLKLLKHFSGFTTKSGFMVGLGETIDDIYETIRDLRSVDVNILTVGQYLQPKPKHAEVKRYYDPSEFVMIKKYAERLGFDHVFSSPFVRSSYHAGNISMERTR